MHGEVRVRVEVDGDGMLLAASRLASRARQLGGQRALCDGVADGLRDPALRAAAGALADLADDVLELVAADLGLLAGQVRAGTRCYDRVEQRVRHAMAAS